MGLIGRAAGIAVCIHETEVRRMFEETVELLIAR